MRSQCRFFNLVVHDFTTSLNFMAFPSKSACQEKVCILLRLTWNRNGIPCRYLDGHPSGERQF